MAYEIEIIAENIILINEFRLPQSYVGKAANISNYSLQLMPRIALLQAKKTNRNKVKRQSAMKNKPLDQSVKMAVVMGLFLPLAETVRRSNHILDITRFFNWFDDYILGSALLLAAYGVIREKANAISYLIAAWGFAAGALALSFLGQFEYYRTDTVDPGVFSTTFVAVAKGSILAYLLVGLHLAIKANSCQQHLRELSKK